MSEPFMDRDPARTGLHARLRGEPDDFIISNYWAQEFTEVENVTCADTADELHILTSALNLRCQGQIDPAYIEAQIAHEAEHAAAARAVGFSRIRYGLGEWIERRTDGDVVTVTTHWQVMVFHVAPLRPVSKLAYAFIVAAPACLSAGDLEALRDMGYRDTEDVAARIRSLTLPPRPDVPPPPVLRVRLPVTPAG